MVAAGDVNGVPSTGSASDHPEIFDAVVIGTGFGGAVTACRLAEAGFSVCVLERGRRYGPDDFPRYPIHELFVDTASETRSPIPDLSRWLWGSDRGLFEISDLEETTAVQAAGYGGGSLIYASVHLRPPYELFDESWPSVYRGAALEPYFDLAAYMLGATPVPRRLAKTAQIKRAGDRTGSAFLLPLAVYFGNNGEGPAEDDERSVDTPVVNRFEREQRACDMRGRCCLGCDRQAKNTLDLNYLARAEAEGCDVHTLAEVTRITRSDGTFTVQYDDLLVPARPEASAPAQTRGPSGPEGPRVRARNVFLCAGAVNTTRLLLKNPDLLWGAEAKAARSAIGTRYFPNADSLAAVLNCDEPHEADYGPTITSALLYDQPSNELFEWTLDFEDGQAAQAPQAGTLIGSEQGDLIAQLVHTPILDTDTWKADGNNAGSLMLARLSANARDPSEAFPPGGRICFRRVGGDGGIEDTGSARVVAPAVRQRHWLLVQDGGYPSDLEPLVGIFSSPLWLRRRR